MQDPFEVYNLKYLQSLSRYCDLLKLLSIETPSNLSPLSNHPLKGANTIKLFVKPYPVISSLSLSQSSCLADLDTKHWLPSNLSNIRRTNSQNLIVSRLVLQLSLCNPLKPGVKLRMKM